MNKPTRISLRDLEKEAKSSKLKKGDRVVFREMYGIWNDLKGLTGVIKKVNKDPVWKYEVEIDFPHLLHGPVDHMRKNDFVTTVAPSALVKVALMEGFQLSPDMLANCNQKLGLDPMPKEQSKLLALKNIWEEMLKMDKKSVATFRSLGKTRLKDKHYQDAAEAVVHCERRLEELNKQLSKFKKVAAPVVQTQAEVPEGKEHDRKEAESDPGSGEDRQGEEGGPVHSPVPERAEAGAEHRTLPDVPAEERGRGEAPTGTESGSGEGG